MLIGNSRNEINHIHTRGKYVFRGVCSMYEARGGCWGPCSVTIPRDIASLTEPKTRLVNSSSSLRPASRALGYRRLRSHTKLLL